MVVRVTVVLKDCGTGAGGFQPGNTCGSSGGGNTGRGGERGERRARWVEAHSPRGQTTTRFISAQRDELANKPTLERLVVMESAARAMQAKVYEDFRSNAMFGSGFSLEDEVGAEHEYAENIAALDSHIAALDEARWARSRTQPY